MSSLTASLPPALFPLSAGLLVTSSMFFGNIGLSLCGPLPIIKEQIGTSTLSIRQKVRVWKLFFDSASIYIVGGIGLSAALHLSVPFLTSSPTVRNLALVSAVANASVLPYTIAFIAPTNSALGKLDKKTEFTAAEDDNALELISRWDRLHKVRYAMYGTAWATGLVALVVAMTGA